MRKICLQHNYIAGRIVKQDIDLNLHANPCAAMDKEQPPLKPLISAGVVREVQLNVKPAQGGGRREKLPAAAFFITSGGRLWHDQDGKTFCCPV